MITAHIDNDYLVLPDNFEWELIRYSQLLSFDKLVDCVIPTLNFPDDEGGHNRAVLNQPSRFTLVRKTVRRYNNFVLRSNGFAMIRGTLLIQSGFSGTIYGTSGKLAELNQDKKITDYNLPTVAFDNKATYNVTDDDYAPGRIKNQQFFTGISTSETYTDEDENEYEETILQHKHRNIFYVVNAAGVDQVLVNNSNLTFTMLSAETYKLTVVSPYLFIFKLIKRLLLENGLYLKKNEIADDADLMSLMLYNNVDINTGGIGSSIILLQKEMKNGEMWVFARYKADAITRAITSFNYADLLPEVSIKDIILGIQNLLNIAFVFNNDTYSIVDREARLLGSSTDIDKFMNGDWQLSSEKKDVSLKFVQKHDDNDAMFSETYVDLSDRLADFGNDLQTESQLEVVDGTKLGELRRVTSVQKIFEWTMTVTTDSHGLETPVFAWQFISVDYQPGFVNYEAKKDIEEITTCFSTLCENGIPVTQQAGKTILRKSTEASFSPRLLFYIGDAYSCSNHTDNYSLKFTGENNMIAKRYKNFAPWWANRQPVSGEATLPENFLQNWDINKKVRTREGEVMPEKATTKFSHEGIGLTKIEGYKVE